MSLPARGRRDGDVAVVCLGDLADQRQPDAVGLGGEPSGVVRAMREAVNSVEAVSGSMPTPSSATVDTDLAVSSAHTAASIVPPSCPCASALSTSEVSARRSAASDPITSNAPSDALSDSKRMSHPESLHRTATLSHTAAATADRSTRSRGAAPAVIVAEASRSLTMSPSTPSVGDQRVGVLLQCSRVTVAGATGQHLRAGVQHCQWRPQFMRCVGDEAALQGQRLRKRSHRSPGEEHDDRDRRQNACQLGESERHQQPIRPSWYGAEIEHRHHPAFGPVHHQRSKFGVTRLDVSETCWPREQFDSRLSPVAYRHPAVVVAQDQLHAGRRVVDVVGGRSHRLQVGC